MLPVSDRFALVEYTEFTPDLLTDAGYDAALTGYRRPARAWTLPG